MSVHSHPLSVTPRLVFYYRAPCEDGYMHCGNGECCEDCANGTWRPTFPVSALVGFDTSSVEGLS